MAQLAEKIEPTTEERDDRRNALRQKCRVDMLIIEHAEIGRVGCLVMDISRKGFRLRMPVCIPCGSVVQVHPPHGETLRVSEARIVRQQYVENNGKTWFECGVQFTEEAELRRHTWFLTLRNAA